MNWIKKYKESILLEQLKLASYSRVIKKFGNSGHVTLPKKFIGKKVLVVLA